MRLFNCLLQESYVRSLPAARIPYGDEDYIASAFLRSELSNELSPQEFLDIAKRRFYIEWCLEQEKKGLKTNEGRGFDYGVYEKFIADETLYELERSTLPEERANRGNFYEARHRVLDAFVQNAIEFLNENKGIDGVPENRRNLRCDLSHLIRAKQKDQAA